MPLLSGRGILITQGSALVPCATSSASLHLQLIRNQLQRVVSAAKLTGMPVGCGLHSGDVVG